MTIDRKLAFAAYSPDDPIGGEPEADSGNEQELTEEQVAAFLEKKGYVGVKKEDLDALQETPEPAKEEQDEDLWNPEVIQKRATDAATANLLDVLEARDELNDLLQDETVTDDERRQVKAALRSRDGQALKGLAVLMKSELYDRAKSRVSKSVPRSEDLSQTGPSDGDIQKEYRQAVSAGLVPQGTTLAEYKKTAGVG